MPRRFFRKFSFKRHEISERWFMSPFRHLLHDHRLWGIRRKTVVPAFSLGLFVACMPFPGHPIWAALAALLLRVNIPVAALATFVSNPLTMGPIYFFAHQLGEFVLGLPPTPFEFELSFEWVKTKFAANWQPLLLGSVLVGAAAALMGFIVLDLIWRYSLADYKLRKRLRRKPDGGTPRE